MSDDGEVESSGGLRRHLLHLATTSTIMRSFTRHTSLHHDTAATRISRESQALEIVDALALLLLLLLPTKQSIEDQGCVRKARAYESGTRH